MLEMFQLEQHHTLNGVVSISYTLSPGLSVGFVGYLWDTCGILTD
jgi:hypothetical protein